MSKNRRALIAWLKTSPDPFGDTTLDSGLIVASVKALLQMCPNPETEHLAYKALNAAESRAYSPKERGRRAEMAYQLVRISVSRVVREA